MADPVEIANPKAATESKDVFMAHPFAQKPFNSMDQRVHMPGPDLWMRL
jgi:hypothetical protein